MPELDQMRVTTMSYTQHANQIVALSGMTTVNRYANADMEIKPNETKRLIDILVEAGHLSVLEHVSATFYLESVPRVLTHQFVRHRIASYTQSSGQYQDFTKVDPKKEEQARESKIYLRTHRKIPELNLSTAEILEIANAQPSISSAISLAKDYIPKNKIKDYEEKLAEKIAAIINETTATNFPFEVPSEVTKDEKLYAAFRLSMMMSDSSYAYLIEKKLDKHFARYVLPQATGSNLMVTMNIRSLDNMFALRICNREFHPFNTMAQMIYVECAKTFPAFFNKDSQLGKPNCLRLGKACTEGTKSCGMKGIKEKYGNLCKIALDNIAVKNDFGHTYTLESDLEELL